MKNSSCLFLRRIKLIIFTGLFPLLFFAQSQELAGLQQASDSSARAVQEASQSPLEMMKGKKEMIAKRDAFSKHFVNNDGIFTAVIGAGPIHYQKDGKYADIDHAVKSSRDKVYPYANRTNVFESYFGATAHAGVKNKTTEGEMREFLDTTMYWEAGGEAVQLQKSSDVAVTVDGDKAYYRNLYGEISAEFIIQTGKRKLNYLIPNLSSLDQIPAGAEYLVFSEDLELPKGWTYESSAEGIVIKDGRGTAIYLYENPISYDAKPDAPQNNTVFEVQQVGNTLTVKTKVKVEWLLAKERQFPVAVDPTVTVYPTATGNYNTGSIDSTGAKTANNDIYVGMRYAYGASSGTRRFMRGWSSFDLTGIPQNSVLSAITFGFYCGLNTLYNPDGQFIRIGPITSGIPNAATGATLYNMVGESGANNWLTLSPGNATGNMSIALIQSQIDHIQSRIPTGIFSMGFYPAGNYSTSYTEQAAIYGSNRQQQTSAGRPYLIITYTIPSPDSQLIVNQAYPGASYADGAHTIANNTSVTATSGTRPGWEATGWTGTGSVPPTGSGGSATFTINQNSSITWLWRQLTAENVQFHNYGGSAQLAFNNSRLETTAPVFRLSHAAETANAYEVEINTAADFSGTGWTQLFTGNFPELSEAIFSFTNGFTPINNATYYVRARAKTAMNEIWSSWSSALHSFTYQTPRETAGWFQTTAAQFQSDQLSGALVNPNGTVEIQPPTNRIVNGSFEVNLNSWTQSTNFGTAYKALWDSDWSSDGMYSLLMYNNAPGTYGYNTNDYMSVYQEINLSDVTSLQLDANYEGASQGVQLRVYIAESSQPTGFSGTLVHTWTPPTGNNSTAITIDLTPYNFTGNNILKLVYYVYNGYFTTNFRYLNVDNVRTVSLPQGSITSTPVHLASVQNATGYGTVNWNQTLDGGSLSLKIQGSSDGSIFTDIAGFTDISEAGDGEKSFDLSGIDANTYQHIRLIGKLDGGSVKLHDWAVEFNKPTNCAVTTTWSAAGWSHGVPVVNDVRKKIVFAADYDTALHESNGGALSGCAAEVLNAATVTIAAGHHLTLENELKVAPTASFMLKSDAALVQVQGDALNEGLIKVERQITASSPERKEYNFLSSPVADQNMKRLFGNDAANTPFAMVLNEASNLFVNAKESDYLIRAKGFAVKEPRPAFPSTLAEFSGEPLNGDVSITVTRAAANRGWNLVGNPYPSALDLHALYSAPENQSAILPEFRFWDNRQNNTYAQFGGNYNGYSYAIYNAAAGAFGTGNPAPGGDAGNNTGTPGSTTGTEGEYRFVKVGQGFLVRAAELGAADLKFTNAYRSATASTGFFGRAAEPEDDRYRLQLSTPAGMVLTTTVLYFAKGSNDFGPEDSRHPSASASDALYSFAGSDKVIINSRANFSDQDILKLGQNHFAAGTYKLRLADRTGLFKTGQRIYLKDHLAGTVTDITENPYTFSSTSGIFTDRFEILYRPQTTLTTGESRSHGVQIFWEGGDLVARSPKTLTNLEVYDLSGRLVASSSKPGQVVRLRAAHLPEGTYVVKTTEEAGAVTTKKIRK